MSYMSANIMLSLIIGFINYNILNKVLNKYQDKKLAMNSTSSIHACSASLIGLIGNWKLMRMNTGGYFLFDIIQLIKNRKMNLVNSLYLYHHTAGLYYMSLNPNIHNWVKNIGWGEFSNIMNYIVYYYNINPMYISFFKRISWINIIF